MLVVSRRILICFFLMAMGLALGSCSSAEEKRTKYFEKGKALFEEGDYGKAVLEFRSAIQVDPEFAKAYRYLGECEVRRRDMQKAFGYFSRAVELDPQLLEAQLSLGYIYFGANQTDKTREKLSVILKKDPEDSKALVLKSLVLIREEQAQEAEGILKGLLAKGE
ncbi:MAG TPA: tetratricopeptide repeat protein, partial [Desulfobacterales bacterium]|nr:tetratricopeptide repeat protein [Desulfobacterales bacterium]